MAQNGVSTFHPNYERAYFSWLATRDSLEGEPTIKSRNQFYLPMPAAMDLPQFSNNPSSLSRQTFGITDDRARNLAVRNPNYHGNAPYAAYLTRAQFPEITSFILSGLMGLAIKDLPAITLPLNLEYLLERATPTGMSLDELYMYFLVEVLTTGRVTGVIGMNENGWPIIIPYAAERLINWKTHRPTNSNQTDAHMLVFEEMIEPLPRHDNERFDHNLRSNFFVNTLTNEGIYIVEEYDQDGNFINEFIPTFMGIPRTKIPFITIGSMANTLSIDSPPLYKIASTAIQIYMRTADLGNSEFLSCNPTLVLTGVDPDQAPVALGSTVTLCLPDSESKAFYPKTDTSALNHVSSHITDLFEQAIYYGAQILDSSKKAAESAETVRLRQASSSATLTGVVHNVAMGITNLLKICAEWSGQDSNKVEFEPVKEFMAPALTANEQKSMVESWVAGAISKFTLVDNFRKAGLLPAGSSVDDEISRIKSEGPVVIEPRTPPRENEIEDN